MYCNYCGANNPDDSRYCGQCRHPLVPTVPPEAPLDPLNSAQTELGLAPGTLLINRYRVLKELGMGGMGVVYLAMDEKLEMTVAIKVLRDVLSRDPGSVKRLIAEARHSMILSHANIVRVHNFEDGEMSKFLVMEYVDGETLGHRLARETKLSEEDTRKIGIEVCKGLEHAHAKNVIHRDLKPGNVLLGKDGSIKLADFGIARVCRDSMSRLTSQQSSGTLLYMSPEQLAGKSNEASDIYSLGIMFYEMLSGEPPFTSGDITYQIREMRPEPVPDISADMNAMVLRCLEKRPENRFAGVGELRDALEGNSKRREEQERALEQQRKLDEEKKQAEEKRRQEESRREEEKRSRDELEKRIRQLLAQGQTAFNAADHSGALSKWEEAQRLSPSDASITDAVNLARRRIAELQEKQRQQEDVDRIKQTEEPNRKEDKRGKWMKALLWTPPWAEKYRRSWKVRGAILVFLIILFLALWAWWDEYGPRQAYTPSDFGNSVTNGPEPGGSADTGTERAGIALQGGDRAGIASAGSGKTEIPAAGGEKAGIKGMVDKGAAFSEPSSPPPGMETWTDSNGLVTVPYPDHWQIDYQGIARIQLAAYWYAFAALDTTTHTSVEVYIMRGVNSVQVVMNNMLAASYALGLGLNMGQVQNGFVGSRPAAAFPFNMSGAAGAVTGWVYVAQAGNNSVCVAVSAPPPIYNAAVPIFQRILGGVTFSY